MAFIRNCFAAVAIVFCFGHTHAQTVYYPVRSSQLLKATAEDLAMLLQKAIPGSHFTSKEYSQQPAAGIIFTYDSSISSNQACRVESNGSAYIRFTASQDNGLNFGVYQYLQQLGFRFYQPGSLWEKIPTLQSAYSKLDTLYTCRYKYKTWAVSGGYNRWAMDNKMDYSWDTYNGENGHNLALYQRRNGMTGEYRFAGHRGDIMNASYLNTLQSNPCYVACFNGSRHAYVQSVPDINNPGALQLWSGSIEQEYTQIRTAIYSNTALYANYYRNFSYYRGLIGIEVPDGALWGNSKDNGVCSSVDYPSESDQQFTLANFTAQKINDRYPDKHFQLYAYSSHANTPSAGIQINKQIDVQVVPGAFQNESSIKGLLNRWYSRTSNVSEYHYMNIPQWGGETPLTNFNDLQQTLDRLKEKNSQGIIWEASPAKFASLPFLWAANRNLKDAVELNKALHEFCDDMFGPAAGTVYTLIQQWSDDKAVTMGAYMQDNKYKLPLYLQLVADAARQAQNAAPEVKERIQELKAYMHYVAMYYDWAFDQHGFEGKKAKAAAICLYLAKSNRMQLVNSYFLILDMVNHYGAGSDFYQQYNVGNGSAYQNGNLALLNNTEIDNNFQQDLAFYSNLVKDYNFTGTNNIKEQMSANGLQPVKKIRVQMGYTAGFNNPNRTGFYIQAPAAGSFTVNYTPHFNMPGKGYLNFTTEATNTASSVIKDISIDQSSGPGSFTVNLPAAGNYFLSIVSKFQTGVDLEISTNGNYFYKKGPFLGNRIENFNNDPASLPGFFYVPAGISRVYFSINNSGPGGSGYATAETISKAFVFKDISGSTLQPRLVTPNDSALFYLELPAGSNGTFCQVQKNGLYNLCFANISNALWCAQKLSTCSGADFTLSVVSKNGNCVTQLTALSSSPDLSWEINDGGQVTNYQNQAVVTLPPGTSANALVTLSKGSNCSVTKRLGDDEKFTKGMEACASGTRVAQINAATPMLYPNPSPGIFYCGQDKAPVTASSILVYNAQGTRVGSFTHVSQFNISQLPAGVYWYKMTAAGSQLEGKLVKL